MLLELQLRQICEGDPPAHSEGLSDKAIGTKAREGERKIIKDGPVEELTLSLSMSETRYCSFASLRLNFFFLFFLFTTGLSGVHLRCSLQLRPLPDISAASGPCRSVRPHMTASELTRSKVDRLSG